MVITGGTQGLGRALARAVHARGAHVTMLARGQIEGNEAVKELRTQEQNGQVTFVRADVTNESELREVLGKVEEERSIDVIITCAGKAWVGHAGDLKGDVYRKSMELNYFGTVNAVLAVLPSFKKKNKGDIILISSGLALCAYTGYSAYAPTKHAIRAFGDTLRNELCATGIRIFQAYPPGFYSPGFDEENKMKPLDTKEIENGEPIHRAEDVATCILDSYNRGDYHSSCGNFGINILTRLASGLNPRNNLIADIFLLPVLAIVGKVYLYIWDSTVRKVQKQEKKTD